MLGLSKEILRKVSFEKYLFRKELIKSLGWLRPEEIIELRSWCFSNFSKEHMDILKEVFMREKEVYA